MNDVDLILGTVLVVSTLGEPFFDEMVLVGVVISTFDVAVCDVDTEDVPLSGS